MMLQHKIVTIGDPHLGHTFKTGVPHHRLGQREQVVMHRFEALLMEAGQDKADLCVCMGDLFDVHTVDNDLVHEVYRMYQEATTNYPDTTYVLLKGNHDWHRDHRRTASFDILHELLQNIDNMVVALHPQLLHMKDGTTYGLFPWMPPEPKTALEWAQEVCKGETIAAAFGHWDSAWSAHNIIPASHLISQGIKHIYTGHEHTPRVIQEQECTITWTGSMMPYAHGQDPTHTLYRTLTLDQYMDLDQDEFHPYCYKVCLTKGESLPYMLDAWEIRVAHQAAEDDLDALNEQVEYEDHLNIRALWDDTVQEIPEAVREDVDSMYTEHME